MYHVGNKIYFLQVLLEYFNSIKSKTEELQEQIVDLYGQLSESRDARQDALNAARASLPDIQAEIDDHGINSFLSIHTLKLEKKVRN